jgi:hypothetical protein
MGREPIVTEKAAMKSNSKSRQKMKMIFHTIDLFFLYSSPASLLSPFILFVSPFCFILFSLFSVISCNLVVLLTFLSLFHLCIPYLVQRHNIYRTTLEIALHIAHLLLYPALHLEVCTPQSFYYFIVCVP